MELICCVVSLTTVLKHVFSLSLFHTSYSMYFPAELHVSAVQGHHQVHYTQVMALSCKYTIMSLIKTV
jgi:hypothetical protein